MRVIAKSTLARFWSEPAYADSKSALLSWHDETIAGHWTTPQDIKAHYRSASICANNRVVFNIAGNKYRLVVEIQYHAGISWVKFIGTHPEYDQTYVETVSEN